MAGIAGGSSVAWYARFMVDSPCCCDAGAGSALPTNARIIRYNRHRGAGLHLVFSMPVVLSIGIPKPMLSDCRACRSFKADFVAL
jgi:hypothetical protein